MTNNQDDFDPPADFDEPIDQPRNRMGANVAEAWRTRPLFKLLVLMIGVGAIIAAIIGVTSQKSEVASRVAGAPELNEPPGGEASPEYIRALEAQNRQRIEAARQSGASALPTPSGEAINIEEQTREQQQANEQLQQFRDELARMQAQQQQYQQQQQVQQQQQQPFDDSLAQAMRSQMNQLLESWQPKQMGVIAGPGLQEMQEERQNAANQAEQQQAQQTQTVSTPAIVVPAGTVSYAQFLTEANSDVPGPILAQILSGPLAGARAVGSFQVARRHLVLTFNLVSFRGKDYAINGLALNPDTTLGGMATEVDLRYFERVVLPAAAAFAEAFGNTLSQGGDSVTVSGDVVIQEQGRKGLEDGLYEGLGEAGETIGDFFRQEAAETRPLIRVAAGTPFGLFFLTSVTDQTLTPGTQPPGLYGMGPYGVASPYGQYGQNQYGQTAYGGYGSAVPGLGQTGGYGYNYGSTSYGSTSPYGQSSYGQGGVTYPQPTAYPGSPATVQPGQMPGSSTR